LRVDRVNLAQAAGGVDVAGLGVENGADALAAGLKDALARLDRLHHRQPVSHRVGHGLFAVNVFPRGHGVDRHAAVQVVRGRNEDGIHILAVEKPAVVTRGGDLRAPGLFRRLMARGVEVGGSDTDTARYLARRAQQIAAANPGAHNGESNLAAGVGLRGQHGRGQQRCLHGCAHCRGACAQTHKIPPRD
jgi:hypothetical protein